MTTKGHVPISSLNRSKTEWKIKVKVIRKWRGATTNGEVFKAFNVILIDQQESKIHAFIPGKCAQQHDSNLREGKICYIKNFTVQRYKDDDKFRPVHDENQIILSAETVIKEIDDKSQNFARDAFDFYDHSDLKDIADKTKYLIDVVGIVENHNSVLLREIMTRQQRKQFQLKFRLTDGSSSVPVTLWDAMAQSFFEDLVLQLEDPVIVILTSCRCGTWNNDVDLSNVGATNFYFNYNHHSVRQIRKMTKTIEYTQKVLGKQKKKITEIHNIKGIKALGREYIEASVILHANIRYVDEGEPWIIFICTECKKIISGIDKFFMCDNCKRRIPHPEKRFKLNVVVSDDTGPMEIQLQDREVRVLIGKRADEVFKENKNIIAIPKILKALAQTDVTLKISIQEKNICNGESVYLANNICQGFYIPQTQSDESSQSVQVQSSIEPSSSSYHLQGMSELNFQ